MCDLMCEIAPCRRTLPQKHLSIGTTKLLRRSFIKKTNGERCSAYFRIRNKERCGSFIKLTTSNGQYVFNEYSGQIHYLDPGNLFVTKVAEHTYCVAREDAEKVDEYICEFYTEFGRPIQTGYDVLISEEIPKLRMLKHIILKADGLWGFFDDDMNVIIEPKYNFVKIFSDLCRYIVKTPEGTAELLDEELQKVADLDPNYYYTKIKDEIRFIEQECGTKRGLIDLTGKQIVPCIYYDIWIKGDFIEVHRYNKYGLYTSDGRVVFECMYPEIIELEDKFVVEEFSRAEVMKKTSEVLK